MDGLLKMDLANPSFKSTCSHFQYPHSHLKKRLLNFSVKCIGIWATLSLQRAQP